MYGLLYYSIYSIKKHEFQRCVNSKLNQVYIQIPIIRPVENAF
jgi:hypothetical protein